MADNDLKIFRNEGLDDAESSESTSSVGEPTAAFSGSRGFITGNWYASTTSDNGTNWSLVDPFTTFPPAAGGFCCDQIVLHDRRRGLWIWILQYVRSDDTNVFRLAACRDDSFGSWYSWTISPALLDGSFSNLWFDYPDAAMTNDHLWVTFNMFNSAGVWQRAAWMKFPLRTIYDAGTLIFNDWTTTGNGSLRLTQGAGTTMYAGSHTSDQQLRLFRWEDAGSTITWWDVDVAQWTESGYTSDAPNGVNWLGRVDGRITAAWAGAKQVGFMWTSAARTGRPNPFIRVVRINEDTKAVIDQPDIWSESNAWAYPAASSNERGELGIAAFYGGATRNPSPVVGVRDETSTSWKTVFSRISSDGPASPAWGDYLSCKVHHPFTHTWVASGYSLEGGNDRRNVEPRFTHFGFEKDTV